MRIDNCKWKVIALGLTGLFFLSANRITSVQRASDLPPVGSGGLVTLETRLPSFSAAGVSRLRALIQLGRQLKLPLGIECVKPGAFEPVGTVYLVRPSMREAVELILGARQGYQLRLVDGVLHITCAEVSNLKGNLFDTVVPRFSISRVNLATASINLRMALEMHLRPGIKGFVGDYAPAPIGHDVGPFTMRGNTVRQILNAVVKSYGEAAWVATAPSSRLGRLHESGLWAIIDYKDPRWANNIQAIRALISN